MDKRIFFFLASLLFLVGGAKANDDVCEMVKPRMRVVIDNDFGGDPDGLFQLAHHLLSPSSDIKAIICSHHYGDFYGHPGHVRHAKQQVDELLRVMGREGVPVLLGSDSSFVSTDEYLESEGARAIVAEAMRDDASPLYVVCGAALTNVASAFLMKPEIAQRITAVVWIGGPEHVELCKNQVQHQREYNQGIDPVSSQVVFNHSDLNIWQIPRDVYRQPLYGYAELKDLIGDAGTTGDFLMQRLEEVLRRSKGSLGETYVLGDSPLVVATSLQTPWERDAASCEYVVRKTPLINDKGFYEENAAGRPIRIFTKIDTRLLLGDFVAKLKILAHPIH